MTAIFLAASYDNASLRELRAALLADGHRLFDLVRERSASPGDHATALLRNDLVLLVLPSDADAGLAAGRQLERHKPVVVYDPDGLGLSPIFHGVKAVHSTVVAVRRAVGREFILSPRQEETLRAIEAFIAKQGQPPVMEELAAMLHVAPNAATLRVNKLVELGFLDRRRYRARSMRVIGLTPVQVAA